jgi:hypothetical protein
MQQILNVVQAVHRSGAESILLEHCHCFLFQKEVKGNEE